MQDTFYDFHKVGWHDTTGLTIATVASLFCSYWDFDMHRVFCIGQPAVVAIG